MRVGAGAEVVAPVSGDVAGQQRGPVVLFAPVQLVGQRRAVQRLAEALSGGRPADHATTAAGAEVGQAVAGEVQQPDRAAVARPVPVAFVAQPRTFERLAEALPRGGPAQKVGVGAGADIGQAVAGDVGHADRRPVGHVAPARFVGQRRPVDEGPAPGQPAGETRRRTAADVRQAVAVHVRAGHAVVDGALFLGDRHPALGPLVDQPDLRPAPLHQRRLGQQGHAFGHRIELGLRDRIDGAEVPGPHRLARAHPAPPALVDQVDQEGAVQVPQRRPGADRRADRVDVERCVVHPLHVQRREAPGEEGLGVGHVPPDRPLRRQRHGRRRAGELPAATLQLRVVAARSVDAVGANLVPPAVAQPVGRVQLEAVRAGADGPAQVVPMQVRPHRDGRMGRCTRWAVEVQVDVDGGVRRVRVLGPAANRRAVGRVERAPGGPVDMHLPEVQPRLVEHGLQAVVVVGVALRPAAPLGPAAVVVMGDSGDPLVARGRVVHVEALEPLQGLSLVLEVRGVGRVPDHADDVVERVANVASNGEHVRPVGRQRVVERAGVELEHAEAALPVGAGAVAGPGDYGPTPAVRGSGPLAGPLGFGPAMGEAGLGVGDAPEQVGGVLDAAGCRCVADLGVTGQSLLDGERRPRGLQRCPLRALAVAGTRQR